MDRISPKVERNHANRIPVHPETVRTKHIGVPVSMCGLVAQNFPRGISWQRAKMSCMETGSVCCEHLMAGTHLIRDHLAFDGLDLPI
jgi:hypothetical protein